MSEKNKRINDYIRQRAGRLPAPVAPDAQAPVAPRIPRGNAGSGTIGGFPGPKNDMNRWIREQVKRR